MTSKLNLISFGRDFECTPWMISPTHIVSRLYYVNAGKAVVFYANKEHTLTAGNVYLLPLSVDYRTVWAENFDHTFFDFRSTATLRYDSFTEIPGHLYNLADYFEFLNAGIKNKTILLSSAKHFCIALITYIEQNYKLPYLTDPHIIKAMDIIKDFPDITIENLSKEIGLNKSYFIRLFTKRIGVGPAKFIRTSRLSEGVQMLQNSFSITEVSEYCGYASPNAFWRAFQKEYGFSPSHIKSATKKNNVFNTGTSDVDKSLYRIYDIYSLPQQETPSAFITPKVLDCRKV